MKTKQFNTKQITTAFINELSARYELPELRSVECPHVPSKRDEDTTGTALHQTEWTHVQPTGQIAAIVTKLEVQVRVFFNSQFGVSGEIHYRYQHHSMGSNGNDQSFRILVESDFGKDYEYMGCINTRLASKHLENIDAIREERAARSK